MHDDAIDDELLEYKPADLAHRRALDAAPTMAEWLAEPPKPRRQKLAGEWMPKALPRTLDELLAYRPMDRLPTVAEELRECGLNDEVVRAVAASWWANDARSIKARFFPFNEALAALFAAARGLAR